VREEVTGSWRRVHNKELYNFFASSYIIKVIKLRKVRWVGHVHAHGRSEKCTHFYWKTKREQTVQRT